MAYRSPGIVSRIDPSSRSTMGCRSGITRRIQSSMSEWLSDGTGGLRAVFGLRGFANLIPSSQKRIRSTVASDSSVATA
jgi:hypothetical protein